jgi:hypothetical protein
VRTHWPLLPILALSATLLVAALDFGLPRTDLGQDERITAARVHGRYATGSDHVPRYNWPELQITVGRFVQGLVRKAEARLDGGHLHPYLIGRAMVVAFGLLMVAAVYFTGARLLGRRTGLLAAAFLAAMPLFTFRSRLWVPDAPMTAFYALALLASAAILQRPSLRRFALAGAAVGLATATKYNGAGAAWAVVVAALLTARDLPRGRRAAGTLARLALAGGCSIAVFTLTNPAILTDSRTFFHGVFWVQDVYTSEPPSGFLGRHVLRYIALSFVLGRPEGVGPLICSLAAFGGVVLLVRDRRAAALVLLPGALYAVTFATVLHNAYERLFMPLLPHVALAAGYGLSVCLAGLERRLPRTRAAATAVPALALLVPALAWIPVVREARAARGTDTRVHAQQWIQAHLPQGATIFREWNMVRPSSALFRSNGRDRTLYAGGQTADEIASGNDFVVVTSTMYDWVLRQRHRPGFEPRAALYDAVLDGPRFELVRAFEPDRRSIGPEVRVYRTLPPKGPRYRPRRPAMELLGRAWASSQRIRPQEANGRTTFVRPWDAIAGKVVLVAPGTYRLEVEASAARPSTLRLEVDGRSSEEPVTGASELALEVALPAGQVWWKVKPAGELDPSGDLTVRAVRLVRER